MIQNSAFWLLLAVMVPVYWLLPVKLRGAFLAVGSALYLWTLDPLSVAILCGLSVFVYGMARLPVSSSMRYLPLVVILMVLSVLGWFKYIPEFVSIANEGSSLVEKMIIPLGISYYTFKLLHYYIECRRGGISEHTFFGFASYIFLFPIFTAGPIERFDHFLAEQGTTPKLDDFVTGGTRIIHGLIKKVLLVDYLIAEIGTSLVGTSYVLGNLSDSSSLSLWAVLGLSYLTLYLEFSAYSDIAIGASRLFGIRIMENFNWPVVAVNISDFWRRWHMTLAAWCQSYVYMPVMGLTRMPYVAAFASFTAIGLWHAGTMTRLSWGFYHASAIVFYMFWTRFRRKRLKWRKIGARGKISGYVITQLFIISSMAFLVFENQNDMALVGRALLKLLFINIES